MTHLYIYSISQREKFNAFAKAIVVASSEEKARNIHPLGDGYHYTPFHGAYWYCDDDRNFEWVDPKKVDVVKIGVLDCGLLKEGDVISKERYE